MSEHYEYLVRNGEPEAVLAHAARAHRRRRGWRRALRGWRRPLGRR